MTNLFVDLLLNINKKIGAVLKTLQERPKKGHRKTAGLYEQTCKVKNIIQNFKTGKQKILIFQGI